MAAGGRSRSTYGSRPVRDRVLGHDDPGDDGWDGTSRDTRPARPASFVVPLRAVYTAQRVAVSAIPIPPTKFKLLVVNKAGQDLTSVDGDNGVKMRTYSPEAQ